MLISRNDRWAPILEKLRKGVDRGIEYPKVYKKYKPVTILGRKMGVKEAEYITGIDSGFFSQYKGQEIPIEKIIDKLENKWMREKNKMLRQGMW